MPPKKKPAKKSAPTKTTKAHKAPAAVRTAKPPTAAQQDVAVAAFMVALKHPLKKEIEAARQLILGVSPAIGEGIKWNAPSFRTKDWFATVNLRAADGVQFIFHKGAKKDLSGKDMAIADPKALLKWLAKDRCLVTLGSGKDFQANQKPFASIVRAWIKQL